MKDIRYTTLFLDRDGVINEKIDGYVKTYSEFKFIDGVLESLKHLSEYFKKIIIVTNQQGIGKKIMTSDDLDRLHNSMINEINSFVYESFLYWLIRLLNEGKEIVPRKDKIPIVKISSINVKPLLPLNEVLQLEIIEKVL